jgi:uncharacterized membrane protein
VICQVLYAIGMAMVCMAGLRRLSSRALLAGALAIQLFGELTAQYHPAAEPLHSLWAFVFVGGPAFGPVRCSYPLAPWLSIMMFGWVLGRWLVHTRDRSTRIRTLAGLGVGLLAVFVVVRALDGYGNWNLHRDSLAVLQWLHVNKYPPSVTYTTLELGLALVLLAGFLALDDPHVPRRGFGLFALLGSTAFFYYLLHVHVLHGAQVLLGLDPNVDGLAVTWIAAAAAIALLAWPCVLYRRYKRAHRDGWTRYL